jgi:hypothetical protein
MKRLVVLLVALVAAPLMPIHAQTYGPQTETVLAQSSAVSGSCASLVGLPPLMVKYASDTSAGIYQCHNGSWSLVGTSAGATLAGPNAFTNYNSVTYTDPSTTISAADRLFQSNLTLSGAAVAAGSNSIAGVRGSVTLASASALDSGYLYGAQGKVVLDGATVAVGAAHVAGVYAQMSASGTTFTSGHSAIIIASGQNLPASSNVDGMYLESGTGPVNSIVKAIFNSNLVFDFSMQSGPGFAETTSSTGAGQCAQVGLTAAKAIPVKIDGVAYWIPLCTAL